MSYMTVKLPVRFSAYISTYNHVICSIVKTSTEKKVSRYHD